jgi:hypothetical protein
MRNTLYLRAATGVAAVALAVSACGGASSHAKAPASKPPASTAPASPAASLSTPAAKLYAALDQLLVEHVDLTANVVQTAVAAGGNLKAPEVKGAIAALTDNTNSLGAAIGSVYGAAAQQQFLKLWNAHIGYFVNYTLGLATHNQAMVATANKDLAGYVTAFSKFIAGATKLPAAAVAADLKGHVATLETAIKAMVFGSTGEGSALLMAENHMAGTAAVLAQGIVSSMPSKFAG